MKIIVRSLKDSQTCVIEATESTSILELKKMIENNIKIPSAQQTLVFLGKTLQDDKTISFYPKIKDGTKIFVALRIPETLNSVLRKFLKRFYSDEQCKLIVDEFMRNFQTKVDSLSLDDLERIAKFELNNS